MSPSLKCSSTTAVSPRTERIRIDGKNLGIKLMGVMKKSQKHLFV